MSRVGRGRLLWAGVAVLSIAGISLLGVWASTPTYVSLYRDLDLREAGEMTRQLEKGRIPHRLGGGGTEILVPASSAAAARVALAQQGLPSSGRPGLELFDKPSWGMTDFTQRVTYQRALEGELARTIGGLNGVERAQVHLVLPTTTGLRRTERPAGASVVLTLKPGVAFTPEAVQGVVYIVSNSVEQLPPDNVAVMDDAGHVLSVPAATAGTGGAASRHLDLQHALEQTLVDKVTGMLETVIGTGRVRAEVAATMNFDQVDRTVESYDPEKQVIQNEQRSETEAATGANGAQTIVNNSYQNSRSVERVEAAAGTVLRLSVAVLVDQKAIGASGPKLAELERMARDAVGIDSTRGDRLSMLAVPFEAVALPNAPGGDSKRGGGPDVIVIAERFSRPLIAVVAIMALILLVMKFPRAAAPEPEAGAAPRGELAGPNGAALSGLPGRLLPDTADKSEAAAQVLRAWLADAP